MLNLNKNQLLPNMCYSMYCVEIVPQYYYFYDVQSCCLQYINRSKQSFHFNQDAALEGTVYVGSRKQIISLGFGREPVCVFITDLSVVTGGDQQICEHQQLVICELLLVFLPVIMMSATEIRQGFLHSHLEKQQIYI